MVEKTIGIASIGPRCKNSGEQYHQGRGAGRTGGLADLRRRRRRRPNHLRRRRHTIDGTHSPGHFDPAVLVAAYGYRGAAEVQAVEQLRAPGRFRLGIGPAHRQGIESTFGLDFRAPLGHLREYLRIVKGVLHRGAIDLDGEYYAAQASIDEPVDVPVMASALRARSFQLCGAEADGAISWVCPHTYVRDVALPALRAGAQQAGRPTPPIIVHAPVCVDEDLDAVREGVRQRLGHFPSTPFYARMFAAAGFPGSTESGWTDEMLESVVISGDEAAVAERLEDVFAWGSSEVLATVIPVGDSQERSVERTMRLLAQVSAF